MSENWSSEAVERARRRTSPEDWATYERVEGWNAFTRQAMMGKSWLTDRVRYDVAVCIIGLPLFVLMWAAFRVLSPAAMPGARTRPSTSAATADTAGP